MNTLTNAEKRALQAELDTTLRKISAMKQRTSNRETVGEFEAMQKSLFHMKERIDSYNPSHEEATSVPKFFKHVRHGAAYLIPNQSFIHSDRPRTINYILVGENEVRASGVDDAGLDITFEELKRLGY